MGGTFALWELLRDIELYEGRTFRIELPGEWDGAEVRIGFGSEYPEDKPYQYLTWVKRPEGVTGYEVGLCGAAIQAKYKLL